MPVALRFPYNSPAGPQQVQCKFEIDAAIPIEITVPTELKLGLSDVGLQTIALYDGGDVIVQQMITNYGNDPINYMAYVLCPGSARQERLVVVLPAGATVIKKYRFANTRPPVGTQIRSGLRELEGDRILNDLVDLR